MSHSQKNIFSGDLGLSGGIYEADPAQFAITNIIIATGQKSFSQMTFIRSLLDDPHASMIRGMNTIPSAFMGHGVVDDDNISAIQYMSSRSQID